MKKSMVTLILIVCLLAHSAQEAHSYGNQWGKSRQGSGPGFSRSISGPGGPGVSWSSGPGSFSWSSSGGGPGQIPKLPFPFPFPGQQPQYPRYPPQQPQYPQYPPQQPQYPPQQPQYPQYPPQQPQYPPQQPQYPPQQPQYPPQQPQYPPQQPQYPPQLGGRSCQEAHNPAMLAQCTRQLIEASQGNRGASAGAQSCCSYFQRVVQSCNITPQNEGLLVPPIYRQYCR